MRGKSILGLAFLLALGGLSAEGAEPQGTRSAPTAGATVSAPTVLDKVVRTLQTIPRFGRLVVTDVLVKPKVPPVFFPYTDFPLPECDPSLDPQVECRVRQPVG